MLVSFQLALLANGIVVTLAVIIALRLARQSVLFTRATGDPEIQEPLKRRILRGTLFLLTLTLTAAIFNLIFVAGG